MRADVHVSGYDRRSLHNSDTLLSAQPPWFYNFIAGYILTHSMKLGYRWATGVASYGALGNLPPIDFQLFYFFSGDFTAAQTLTFTVLSLPTRKYCRPMVYCMNFIIFSRVTLKLFSVSFVSLLTPNPGDATILRRARQLCILFSPISIIPFLAEGVY